ncbi:MAG: hypothetical protein Q7T87_01080 [Polaromonas sp.]|nr:hypothetical protein [Polaromonas sp.]
MPYPSASPLPHQDAALTSGVTSHQPCGLKPDIISANATSFVELDPNERSSFRCSDIVRYWLVLCALDNHRAGDYVSNARHLEAVFALIIDGVRTGRITLDFRPESFVAFHLPARHDPQYIQALVYWCAKMKCPFEIMVVAHSQLGNHASLRRLFSVVGRLHRELTGIQSDKVMLRRDPYPPTIPTQLA